MFSERISSTSGSFCRTPRRIQSQVAPHGLKVSGDGFRKKLPPPYITGTAPHSKREMSLLISRRQRRTVSPEISRLLNGLSSRCCLLQLMFTHHQTISTPLLCPNKEKTLLSKSPKLQSVTPTISRAPPFLSASSSSGYL